MTEDQIDFNAFALICWPHTEQTERMLGINPVVSISMRPDSRLLVSAPLEGRQPQRLLAESGHFLVGQWGR